MTRKNWMACSGGVLRTWTLGALFGVLALLSSGSKAGANVSMMVGPAQMTYKSGAEYVPTPPAPLYVLAGTTVTFRTYCQSPIMGMPAVPGAKNWSVTGAGASIVSATPEDTVNISFTETSANTNDYKVVHAKYNLTGDDDASVNVVVYDLIPIMTPDDDFTNRSQMRYGITELVHLSFSTSPAGITADQIGGLGWAKTGGGALSPTASTSGIRDFSAGSSQGEVTLTLHVSNGPSSGETRSVNRQVVTPNGGRVEKLGTQPDTFHVQNKWSSGFWGAIFVYPKDVSFKGLRWSEGTCAGAASGWLRDVGLNNWPHTPGGEGSVGAGDATLGCMVTWPAGVVTTDIFKDRITTGALAPGDTSYYTSHPIVPTYAEGAFNWPIPHRYALTDQPDPDWIEYVKANHHMTSDAAGTAMIEKLGSSQVTKALTAVSSTPPGF